MSHQSQSTAQKTKVFLTSLFLSPLLRSILSIAIIIQRLSWWTKSGKDKIFACKKFEYENSEYKKCEYKKSENKDFEHKKFEYKKLITLNTRSVPIHY